MQDQSLYSQMNNPTFPEQEHLKCPRCDSPNTKFCYYNNYNLSQPRHYCKNCKRYWTKGGALRNIPIGGGSRKNSKRSSTIKKPSSSSSPSSVVPSSAPIVPSAVPIVPSASSVVPSVSSTITATGLLLSPKAGLNQDHRVLGTLLGPVNEGQSGNLTSELSPDRPGLRLGEFVGMRIPGSGSGSGSGEVKIDDHQEGCASNVEKKNSTTSSSSWKSSNWPDLAIFTPTSNFQ
ncbi:hypothetical protein LIER_17298 [Lithospermum erythrorhizon]|uniref:Dof zinc finger protein n=1 Tax=Lithospermum erythrorhizon TaxID=34254 RepID=A0AAV3QD30_LITER